MKNSRILLLMAVATGALLCLDANAWAKPRMIVTTVPNDDSYAIEAIEDPGDADLVDQVLDADSEATTRTIINEDDPDKVTTTTVTTTTETKTVPVAKDADVYDHEYDEDDIHVKVRMDDEVYQTNQDVDGRIVVYNTSPEPLPATFHVKLFHNDQLFRQVRVETEDKLIPPGVNTYTLDEFGIPDLNENRNFSGDWVIMVYKDDPAQSEEVKFRVERIDI